MSMAGKFVGQNISFSGTDMVVSMDAVFPDGTKINRVIGSLQTLTYSVHMDKFPVRSIGNVNAKDYVYGPRTIAGSLIFAVFNKHFAYELLDKAREAHGYNNYHFLADELPPLNITVSLANEYGATARLAIYGVRIINEGQTMSVNDIYTENTYQFVATDLEYLNDKTGSSSSASKARRVADSIQIATTGRVAPNPIPIDNQKNENKFYRVGVNNNTMSIMPGQYNQYDARERTNLIR